MSSLTTALADLVCTVRRPGDFYATGRVELTTPRMEVEGIGTIALPLLPIQAEQLIAIAQRAPFGRGADTLIDTTVRRSWQIEAARVRIGGKHWPATLASILARVAEGLGLDEPIEAELYKLLVYDQGSFFVSHRDTEKAPGMFGTLVLALPSQSTGGELVVRHKGREASLDLRCEDPSELAFAAFFADCMHEVRPVTSGCRLTLVYNLVRKTRGAPPGPPSYERELSQVTALLQHWSSSVPGSSGDAPLKVIYPLEHAYTPVELSFATLKGADAAAASLLTAAAPLAGCDLHLALLSIEESGWAEYNGGYGSRHRRESYEPDFEIGEVDERHESLSEWRRPDATPSPLTALPIRPDELSPPDALDDLEPDEQEFHEATGNEGASFERSYQRAALVLWPRAQILAVLNQAGLPATLPYLDDLTARWSAAGVKGQKPLWWQAHELAGHMISTWTTQPWYPAHQRGPSEAARLLAALTRLADREAIEALIAALIVRGGHETVDNAALLAALAQLPLDQAAETLARLVAANSGSALDACADLLARALRGRFAGKPARLARAVQLLVEALPGDPARAPNPDDRRYRRAIDATVIADLVRAVDACDATLAGRAADTCLAWPKIYGIDAILAPALRSLVASRGSKRRAPGPAFARLRDAVLAHLRRRAAEPLAPPPDWTRDSKVSCSCAHCSALSRFLADAAVETWTLKAAEPHRRHVEATIQTAKCDVDVRTERRGSPHGLVCSKTQASYERRVVQRRQDMADFEALAG